MNLHQYLKRAGLETREINGTTYVLYESSEYSERFYGTEDVVAGIISKRHESRGLFTNAPINIDEGGWRDNTEYGIVTEDTEVALRFNTEGEEVVILGPAGNERELRELEKELQVV